MSGNIYRSNRVNFNDSWSTFFWFWKLPEKNYKPQKLIYCYPYLLFIYLLNLELKIIKLNLIVKLRRKPNFIFSKIIFKKSWKMHRLSQAKPPFSEENSFYWIYQVSPGFQILILKIMIFNLSCKTTKNPNFLCSYFACTPNFGFGSLNVFGLNRLNIIIKFVNQIWATNQKPEENQGLIGSCFIFWLIWP